MNAQPSEAHLNCAIYTRKSLDTYVGEFGSLEAQRSICSSYISSQVTKGWIEYPKIYEDLGKTGANLDRPGLQELLRDIESGLIDIVVIYKLDRITRTIVDFVRLMDLFETCGVHFVSVTQNFDTANSTGRLIQNILLTFAQFEREMAGDRLRDKFRVMKERGMFVGGHPPFGFDLVDKQLVPNNDEAEIVRRCFKLYLEAKSFPKVAKLLAAEGVARRSRMSKRGHVVAGNGISTSSVYNMIHNPIYVGRVRYKGKEFPGLHDGVVSDELWDAVQRLCKKRSRSKVVEKFKTDLLRGLAFDSCGRTLGVFRDYRYNPEGTRYYRSNQNEWGRRNGVRMFRVKADDLDELVLGALGAQFSNRETFRELLIAGGTQGRELMAQSKRGPSVARILRTMTIRQLQAAIRALVDRIDLSEDEVLIFVRPDQVVQFSKWDGVGLFSLSTNRITSRTSVKLVAVPTTSVRIKRDLSWLYKQRQLPSSATKNSYLIKLVRTARRAQRLVDDHPELAITEVAKRSHCTMKRLPRLLRLNYLAPDIIAAILDGRQPEGLSGHKMMAKDLPLDWSLQRKLLGFAEQQDTLAGAPGW